MATRKTAQSEVTQETPVQSAPAKTERPAPVKKQIPEVDLHQTVTVRNGFHGTLVYVSKKTGETFVWDDFGDEQDMEIGELRNAKNSSKAFFINNWFCFDEPWIVHYLGVERYYKDALGIDDFKELFDKAPEEISRVVSKLSAGQKQSLSYMARNMVSNGEVDSNRKIAALEDSLGITLVER